MAVAIDTSSSGTVSGANSLTYSHTCTGATYLAVAVADWTGDNVTGVTYGGVAMTLLCKETRTPDSGSLEIYWYGLANPTAGANNVVVSRSTSSLWIQAGSVSLTGTVTTTSPVDATATEPGSASQSSDTLSITTVADNTAVLIAGVADNGNIAASTNATELIAFSTNPGDNFIVMRSTTFPKTPAGASMYSMTFGANSGHGMIAISIAPAGGGGAVASVHPTLLTLGVG